MHTPPASHSAHMEAMLALWSTCERFDADTRAQAARIAQDPQLALSAFSRELSFGTGGLRGILGVGTNRMNVYTVARATTGLAAYLVRSGGSHVAIAYDSRNGSALFARIAACVLAQYGIVAHCYDRLMPTPMLSYAVRALGCDAGIVITASHNPAQYNGYKVYGADGCQITEKAAAEITACIERVRYEDLVLMDEEDARAAEAICDIPQRVFDGFLRETLACRVEDPTLPMDLRLVYTPLYGTGLEPVCAVLEKMGVDGVTLVREQSHPDGNFPTCPKPNPEIREALTLALETAAREQVDLVVATDPDCDRVGVAVRAKDGSFTILTGNEVGLLLLEYLLRTRRQRSTLPEQPVVVKTIVTSDLAFPIAQAYGAQVTEVLTGFKYIGEVIGDLEAAGQADRFVFGFEESCGYLAGTHVRDKDGVMAVTLITDMAQHYAREGRSLLDALEALYGRYGYMENALLNFDIEDALPMEKMQRTMAALRATPPSTLCGEPVERTLDYLGGVDGLPKSDVLTFVTASGLKAIVRPSGTEPKIKVYLCARADSRQAAHDLIDTLTKDITAILHP